MTNQTCVSVRVLGIKHRKLVKSASDDLLQDHERLLDELEHMHQADRLRQRQRVSMGPSGIPQPLYMRQEAREDFQREMEFALEDMYTGERGKNRNKPDSDCGP